MLCPAAARCQGNRPWHVGRGGAIWSGGIGRSIPPS